MTMIFVRDKIRDATADEKEYVKSIAQYAIEQTIETNGLSLYWSEPGNTARYSTQYPMEVSQRKEKASHETNHC